MFMLHATVEPPETVEKSLPPILAMALQDDEAVKMVKKTDIKPFRERADQRWVYIGKLVDPVTGYLKYQNLSHVMLQILSIPISQAAAERQFSMIRKTYKKDRASMDNNTLSDIMVCKTNSIKKY